MADKVQAETEPAETEPGASDRPETEPAEAASSEAKAGEAQADEAQPGDAGSADGNRGESTGGDRSLFDRTWFRLLCGAVIGAAFSVWVYGWDFVSGDPEIWNSVGGDAGSALAALRYYLDEPWGWPLLEARSLDHPNGLVIIFTDSLSAWALVAKTFGFLGLSANQWFALWYVVVFALQGLAAVAAVRSFRIRSFPVEMSVAVIAVSAPIMMLRTWHPGLAAQFLLLAAVAAVGLLATRQVRPGRVLAGVTVLTVFAVLIQPYLLLGVLVIAGAGAIGSLARGDLTFRTMIWWVAGSAVSLGVVLALSGFISSGAEPAAGYGLYGTYVFGAATPQWSAIWPGDEWILEANGSFEGFNWVGMGWLLLVLAVVASRPRQVLAAIQRHQVLAAVLLVVAAYAVTPEMRMWRGDGLHDWRTPLGWLLNDRTHHNKIYGLGALLAGGGAMAWMARDRSRFQRTPAVAVLALTAVGWGLAMLVAPGILVRVTGQFRVSGRLLWTSSYVALIGAAVLAARWWPKRVVAGALMVFAAIQVYDVQQFREQAHDVFRSPEDRVANVDALAAVAAVHDEVHLEPDFNCAAGLGGTPALLSFQDVVIGASRSFTPVDNVYAARQELSDCQAAPALSSEPGVLNTVIVPPEAGVVLVAPEGQECRALGSIVACTDRWSEIDPEIAARFVPMP